MSDVKFDLLTEPLFRVRRPSGRPRDLSLPGVLATLSAGDELMGFTSLRHHQRHPWHAFLVQSATMAAGRAGFDESHLPTEPDPWREALLALADGRKEAFCLLVPDLGQPAFLQSPVPEGSLAGFTGSATTPDALDVLITSKNHDLKMARMTSPRPEHWVFALLSLQTMQGFFGAGKWGIVRMNGGFGSRPGVSYIPGLSLGARFRRELALLLSASAELTQQYHYQDQGGVALSWLDPWDGAKGSEIALERCDPYFIEICRRVRLVEQEDALLAKDTTTKAQRISGGKRNGDLGDAWTPLEREHQKALTVSHAGFSYKLLQILLFGTDYQPSLAQSVSPADKHDLLFLGQALARGQGKTEGYHERIIPLPSRVRSMLRQPDQRERLATRAAGRVTIAETIRTRVLRPSLLILLQAGKIENRKDKRPDRWTRRLDEHVDDVFFEALWDDLELDLSEAELRWAQQVLSMAEAQLASAQDAAPIPAIRRFRAEAAAWSMFHGTARKHFPDLYPREGVAHHV